jgi:hypothetical protein
MNSMEGKLNERNAAKEKAKLAGGQAAGIVANNPMQMGGHLTVDAADTIARFVRFCDAFHVPLVYFADSPGALPAVHEEARGLIRHGETCSKRYFDDLPERQAASDPTRFGIMRE